MKKNSPKKASAKRVPAKKNSKPVREKRPTGIPPSDNIITTKDIGMMVKERRRALGLSQESLARKLDVTYQQVQRYENGKNKISVEHIQTISKTLGVPFTYFFNENVRKSVGEKTFLSPFEKKLLKIFRKVSKAPDKKKILGLMQMVVKFNK